MDVYKNISLSKPLRKMVLSGGSMEPKKEDYVLFNVHKYITCDKKIAKKEICKEEECIKLKNECPTESPASKIPDDNLAKEIAAKNVFNMENHTIKEMFEIMRSGKPHKILTSLVFIAQQSSLPVCKEYVVLLLVLLIKKSYVKLVTECYSQVRNICTSTRLFMLFIQLMKMYSVATDKKSGWGRGMKKAVKYWYLKWKPEDLALDVIRNPSAYGWSHKDVLKMAHINLKTLPTGTQAVLTYIFSGYENTRKKFEENETAADILHYLEILQEKAKDMENPSIAIERGKKILREFKSISLSDFPVQAETNEEVISLIIENGSFKEVMKALANAHVAHLFMNNKDLMDKFSKRFERKCFEDYDDVLKALNAFHSCRRMSWVGSAILFGNIEDEKEEKTLKIPHQNFQGVMAPLITRGTQAFPAPTNSLLIYVDIEPNMEKFISTQKENSGTIEMRGYHAVSFLIMGLAKMDDIGATVPLLFHKVMKVEGTFRESGIEMYLRLNTAIKMILSIITDRIDVDKALNMAVEKAVASCAFIYFSVDQEAMQNIVKKMKTLREGKESFNLRLVVLFLEKGDDVDITPFEDPNILWLFGFNQYTLATMHSYIDGHI